MKTTAFDTPKALEGDKTIVFMTLQQSDDLKTMFGNKKTKYGYLKKVVFILS